MGQNLRFYSPALQNGKRAAGPGGLGVDFEALTELVVLLAQARGRARVTPRVHLGLSWSEGRKPKFVPIVRFPGGRRKCAWAPFGAGSAERGAHPGTCHGRRVESLSWEVRSMGRVTGPPRGRQSSPTGARSPIPGGAGPLVRRLGGPAQQ